VFPGTLYSLLPYPVDYVPYSPSHVMAQTELLFFSALAFTLLILSGIYPSELRAINLDFDWFYRKGARLAVYVFTGISAGIASVLDYLFIRLLPSKLSAFTKKPISIIMGYHGEEYSAIDDSASGHPMPETTNFIPSGVPVLIAVVFLSVLAVIYMALS